MPVQTRSATSGHSPQQQKQQQQEHQQQQPAPTTTTAATSSATMAAPSSGTAAVSASASTSAKKPTPNSTSKVYRSTPAAPQQRTFSNRRRSVRQSYPTTYGRQRRPSKMPALLVQDTLTQMNFVSSSAPPPVELDDEDEQLKDDEQEDEEEEAEEDKSKTAARSKRRPGGKGETPSAKKVKKGGDKKGKGKEKAVEMKDTRRRTMGDKIAADSEEETTATATAATATATRPRRQQDQRNSKRRKTTGDEPMTVEDNIDEDTKSSTKFHTQTLTQLVGRGLGRPEDLNIQDSEEEEDLGLVQDAPEELTEKAMDPILTSDATISPIKRSRSPTLATATAATATASSVTPRNKRHIMAVVPSSQSPTSSLRTTPLVLRYSPAKEQSPLKSRSTNVGEIDPDIVNNIARPFLPKPRVFRSVTPQKRKLTIQDSNDALDEEEEEEEEEEEDDDGDVPATPTPKANMASVIQKSGLDSVISSGQKKIRFEVPESNKENFTPGRDRPKSPPKLSFAEKSDRLPLAEVPDSDNDDDLTDPDETTGETTEDELMTDPPDKLDPDPDSDPDPDHDTGISLGEPGPAGGTDKGKGKGEEREKQKEKEEDHGAIQIGDDTQADDAHYPIGKETQSVLISAAASSHRQTPSIDSLSREETPDLDQQQTPTRKTPKPSTSTSKSKWKSKTKSKTRSKESGQEPKQDPSAPEAQFTQAYNTQYHTQFFQESQRVPLGTIRATGPITNHSDILISLYHEPASQLVNRSKTHEFRMWKVPESVHRVWIYVTKPHSVLKYMCILGPAQLPGEIHENGLGNKEFNEKKRKASKYAYEVLSTYELNDPVDLDTMRKNGWPAAPRCFSYLPPAIVGILTANLRCALWGEDGQEDVQDDVQDDDNMEHEHQEPEPAVLLSSSPPPRPRKRKQQRQQEDDELSTPVTGKTRSSAHLPPASSAIITVSQEVENQIRSDLTQHQAQLSSEPVHPTPRTRSAVSVLHSEDYQKASNASSFALPQLPPPPPQRSQRTQRTVRSSQATTISQPSTSSSPRREREQEGETPFSLLRSSQFPTRSQLLPDSLLLEEPVEPPEIVWDSADEEDD